MPEVATDVCAGILQHVRAVVSPDCYQAWFKDLTVLDVSNGVVHMAAPNRFVRQWLEAHYRQELLTAAAELLPEVHNVALTTATAAADSAVSLAQVLEKTLPSFSTDGRDSSLPERDGRTPRRDTHRVAPLSPKFRLESFIVGKSNRLAHVAAQSVVESPGRVYNPLFLHGAHGLGKTHLMQGIAHALQERTPPANVIYLSCEEFTNAYVWAVQNRRLDAFRERFRNCDALLMDDVQFLAGREKTQEEFLHTFDALRQAHKQVVLCADAAPRDIKRLDPKLVTRFQSELVARLEAPDVALRMELVREKAKTRGMHLAHDVVELLSAHIENNVRDLEGVVCKLMALAAARRDDCTRASPGAPGSAVKEAGAVALDRELALVALRELGYLRSGPPALADVLEAIAKHYGVTADDLRSGKRHARLVQARHVGMYLSKLLTSQGVAEIGRFYGNRDHATVLHACGKIADQLKREENLQSEVQRLKQVLGR
ncbi:MAG: chromosomal replication initiator protein DnaA [Planctomycetota bacterium]|nr:chromosomal replication initiator protein DnaA [Planctomycetota bacterium]